jgi:hypothetical protein
MKNHKVILITAIALMLQSLAIRCVTAQGIFPALLSATCISTNEDGDLVYKHFGNADLIRECAGDEGITNLSGLSLVFNPGSNTLEVVAGTNQTAVGTNHVLVGTNKFLICTPLTFTNTVSLSGANTNKVELLASIFVETNSVSGGSLAATERFSYGKSNQLESFRLVGRIQYAVAASGTNGAKIYRGALVAGSGVRNDEDEDEDEDGNNGNNGKHLGQGKHEHGHENNGHHGK